MITSATAMSYHLNFFFVGSHLFCRTPYRVNLAL